jgi:hypothetical protein
MDNPVCHCPPRPRDKALRSAFVSLCEPTVKTCNRTGPLVMKPRVEELAARGKDSHKDTKARRKKHLIDLPRNPGQIST